jgi:hypothetical protein
VYPQPANARMDDLALQDSSGMDHCSEAGKSGGDPDRSANCSTFSAADCRVNDPRLVFTKLPSESRLMKGFYGLDRRKQMKLKRGRNGGLGTSRSSWWERQRWRMGIEQRIGMVCQREWSAGYPGWVAYHSPG